MKTWVYSWILYPIGIAIAYVWGLIASSKVRESLALRSWKNHFTLRYNAGSPIEYWIHVASAGELEYAIPIIEELRRVGRRVLISYYSISARDASESLTQRYENVSWVVPLPHDGLGLMTEFVSLVRRMGVKNLLLMKYELWPGMLWECNTRGIRVFLVNALRPSWFHRLLFHKIHSILTGYVSELAGVSHPNARIVGDTRVERVLGRAAKTGSAEVEVVRDMLPASSATQRPRLICGSMWPEDDRVILGGLELLTRNRGRLPDIVWVPHELSEVQESEVRCRLVDLGYRVRTYGESGIAEGGLQDQPLAIIVMKKGILAELYELAPAAFVGGGFGKCVHSVWEPALKGARVGCGPHVRRAPETGSLQELGLLTVVRDSHDLWRWLTEVAFSATDAKKEQVALQSLVSVHTGAASRVVDLCERPS